MSIEQIIRNIIREELSSFKSEILSAIATQNQPVPTQEPTIAPDATPPEQPKYQDTTIYKKYFSADWDPTKTLQCNLDAICAKRNTNIAIFTRDSKKTIYRCEFPYDAIQNLVVESLKKPIKELTPKPINDLSCNSGEKLPAAKHKELAEINEKLDVSAINEHDLVRKIIHKASTGRVMPISDIETDLNINFSRGGVHYLKGGKDHTLQQQSYSFDINSYHPYILQSPEYTFPMREGRRHMSQKSTIDLSTPALYFIKTANIEFFRQRTDDPAKFICVSNYMLQTLNSANVPWDLTTISDSESEYNSYVYHKHDCMTLDSLFGGSVRALYDLKPSNPIAKDALQKIFGFLIEKQSTERIVDADGNFEAGSDDEIEHLDGKKIKITTNTDEFKLPFGRIKLMFYDACRHYLYHNFIQGRENSILRIKVDSILFDDNFCDTLPVSSKIGDLKREYRVPSGTHLQHVNVALNTLDGVRKYDPTTQKFKKV